MSKPISPHVRHRPAAHPGRTAAEIDVHLERATARLRARNAVDRPRHSVAQVEARVEKHLKVDHVHERSAHRGKPAAG
ncbi:MAG TPA: hypothetical protein VNM34_16475 [Verrucomicrobiae bacterium]|nr:hypothetical protein [Verrucomicrobiae bacterium]